MTDISDRAVRTPPRSHRGRPVGGDARQEGAAHPDVRDAAGYPGTETAETTTQEAPPWHDPDADADVDVDERDHFAAGARAPLQTRMHHYFEATSDRVPAATALEWEGGEFSYGELEAAANRMAHHLIARFDIQPGDRIGLIVPRSPQMYVALLAIQKAGAAFVPVDPQSPADRVEYFTEDAGLGLVITSAEQAGQLPRLPTDVLVVEEHEGEIASRPDTRPALPDPSEDDEDPTAYIIYTSGSSGRPKGVDVTQPSICNFLHVITEVYDVRPSDRVYQGMTISFDFAIEEVWPTWAVGATLVAGPTDGRRVGHGLTVFLQERAITLLYCVPTVLSTVEHTIPSIRGLMVGGEACPAELVERWAPGRRMLNTYGPTEATVTCTVGVLQPGRKVTIGVPVPTYTAVILDEDRAPVPDGHDGELAIGGIGVARGYLNRPDLTHDRFILHPSDPAGGRIYRTGDLARIQEDGEIVYLGRADAEVKIRGHRVDLGEIESLMMRDPAVPTAAVKHLNSAETGDELAAYLVLEDSGRSEEVLARVYENLRASLPPYMVPSFMETVTELPMLVSGKVDRKSLPDPTSSRLIGGTGEVEPPQTPTEEWLRSLWANTFAIEDAQLSVTADFFADLSGHSLTAANLTSRLRQDARSVGMSVLDLYNNPTVRELAAHVDSTSAAEDSEAEAQAEPLEPRRRESRLRIACFGLAQLVSIFIMIALSTLPIALIYAYHNGVPSGIMIQQIILTFPLAYLAERWILPVLLARFVGSGIRPGRHRLYGATHFRVWLVGKAMALSPLNNLAGSAFAAPYLRAAGATIGEGVHVGTSRIPVPSLVEIGDDATIGYASHLQGFAIHGGALHIGQVVLRRGATVAANCVLVGSCAMGEGSVLRAQSMLRGGEELPAHEAWQGSPAKKLPSVGDPIIEIMASCQEAPRDWSDQLKSRFAWGLVALEFAPLVAMLPVVVLVWWVLLAAGVGPALVVTALTGPIFVVTACLIIVGLRRFGQPRTPVGIHHLRSGLGVDKWFADKLLELSLLLTNTLYSTLYTAPWLRRLGAHIGKRAEVSTIANIDPDLLTIGDESFVADMASLGSATYCNSHVAFRPTTVGRRAFVGNASFVPSGTYLGDNSLIGVASTPPPAGIREGTSWLGSPSIFLPRREVLEGYTDEMTFEPKRSQVRARWLIEGLRIVLPSSILALSFFATLYFAGVLAAAGLAAWQMVLAVPAVGLLSSLAVVLLVAAMKWIIVGRYRPRVEPLWSLFVRRTEFVTGVFEASAVPALLNFLTGTPMLGPILRLFGAHVGRRTLIDTTYITEFDLVRIGDDAEIGTEVSLQTHLFEDRVMKMNVIDIQPHATIGTRAIVLYDTRVGEGTVLAPLSLVMKGEALPDDTTWAGIPAQPARRPVSAGASWR